MKILLLRANELRHKALAQRLANLGYLSGDLVERIQPTSNNFSLTNLERLHFKARAQVEQDFFSRFERTSDATQRLIPRSGINSQEFYELVDEIEYDVVITFGVSILSGETIQKLRDRILGIHLGLSPFYRGSGTNFFPFVNKELGAVGYTLMHLDEGVDTGRVIHQGRAPIVIGDSIHSIGSRNIEYLFRDICLLLEQNVDLANSIPLEHSGGRLYKRRDFTEEALLTAMRNLSQGLIEDTLRNIEFEIERFPIHKNELFDAR